MKGFSGRPYFGRWWRLVMRLSDDVTSCATSFNWFDLEGIFLSSFANTQSPIGKNTYCAPLVHSVMCCYCSSQPSMVQWLSSSIFPCSLYARPPAMVTSDQISTFSIYTGIIALYWPCTIKIMSIPTFTDPVPPSTSRHRHILIQYHQVPICIAF